MFLSYDPVNSRLLSPQRWKVAFDYELLSDSTASHTLPDVKSFHKLKGIFRKHECLEWVGVRQRLERTFVSSPKLHYCKWRILALILIFCGSTTARMCHGCVRVQLSLGKHRKRGFKTNLVHPKARQVFIISRDFSMRTQTLWTKSVPSRSFFRIRRPYVHIITCVLH